MTPDFPARRACRAAVPSHCRTDYATPMTWVIGATTPFGYGVLLSDPCVTWKTSDGEERRRDSVKKTYPVGRFIAAGFSGSVMVGFDLIDSLLEFLATTEKEKKDTDAWKPKFIAENWPRLARRILRERGHDSPANILMVGVDPERDSLFRGRPVGVIFRSPNFEPEYHDETCGVFSIGSGSSNDAYVSYLRDLLEPDPVNEIPVALQMEVSNPGGMGRFIASSLTRMTLRNPIPGIGNCFHIHIVRLGGIWSGSNSTTKYDESGNPDVHVKMPPVATDFAMLQRMLEERADAVAPGKLQAALGM